MATQRLRLEIDASPAYELVLSLASATAGGDGPEGLVDEVRTFAGGCDMVWAHLLTVAYETAPPRDPAALIQAIRAMHPRELRLRLLGYYVRYFRRATPPEVIAAAVAGDEAAVRQFRESSYPEDQLWQSALRALLPLDGWETRRRLLKLLADWSDHFASAYDAAPLLAEAASRRIQARSARAEQMVAAVMDGWEYIAEPGINAVLLVPSLVIWPAAHVFDHHSTKIVCYPIRPATSAGPDEPPIELLRTGQAVADERRLRILRLLAHEELTASELGTRLGIGLTTVLHHLRLLLGAGLLSASSSRRKVYRLRREGLADLERALAGWLG
ncbi:MAG TPA: ArsR family transcriptional regulator [Candidatus Dormibacteraeota bacterium]